MSVEEKLERLFDKNVFTASWSADAKRLMLGWVTKIFDESRPHGKWIDLGDDMILRWVCSKCGRKDRHIFNFCPDCGADMRRSEAE